MRAPLLLLPLLCLAGGLRAQVAPLRLDPGARVRVVAPSRTPARETGTVQAMGPDSLVLVRVGGGRLAIPYREIDTVRVSLGPDRWRGARRGASLGALVGVGAGVIGGALGARNVSLGIGESALVGAAGAGVLGAGIGAGVGVLLAPERWRPYLLVHPETGAGVERGFRP